MSTGSVRTDRVDPRCERSQQRALAAAVELLREDGLPGLTFEAVAARSGVAKSTLYRHFEDRAALHLAAIESVGPVAVMSVTDDLRADLVDFLAVLEHTLHHSDFGAILPTAIDGAERSEKMAAISRVAASQRREQMAERLRLAQHDGTLDCDVDLDLLSSLLVGPIFYRRFFSRQSFDPAFVPALVDQVLRTQPAPSRRT
jgi:AcrR family transcriptional regulator